MRRRAVVSGLAMLPAAAWAQAGTVSPDIAHYVAGRPPPEFETGWRTGRGAVGTWQAVEDATARGGKAIEQSSADPTDYRFPLAVYRMAPVKDVEASVRFKAVSGKGDRAGGLAVRVSDVDNYYVVRANALEDNVNLYRVVKGRRIEIKGATVKVASGVWHDLAITVRGAVMSVSFNGAALFGAEDGTIPGPGEVALWTKADSVTRFHDLVIHRLP
jgi:hypothetical protein